MSRRIKVFAADDHPLVQDAMRQTIKSRPELELVGSAGDGRTALDEIRRLEPDVAVLDVRMADLDGGEVLNALVRDGVRTRVLFLSTHTDGSLIYDLLAAGAAGYLDKVASADEICTAISAAARGETVLNSTISAGVFQQIRLRSEDQDPTLTKREREVLNLTAEGLSASEVATRLFIEQSTVKSHLKSIYSKLGVSDRAAAVAEGMRRGLLE
jgi:two-component system nitrate/nitrite response regulator NarL